ncbi:MAG TPA: glycosyltransferase family 4 protein, partial [Chitinophagaceae bacterium]|nr:glycosyltransferase family 4 protein [Chitinophagaceae bacterium]
QQLIKENGFDTIIWEHPYYAWLAKRIQKRTGIKTILHTHNIEFQRFRSTGRWWWPILRNYEKRFFKKADHILFISPEDKSFAINQWKIPAEKCIDLPFGVDITQYPADRPQSRELIANRHGISKDEKILFFNGLLNYKPNLDALRVILDQVNPLLLKNTGFKYKILICGKGLPGEMRSLEAYKDRNLVYAGYTDEIASYYKASDILLNPVLSGGGVKTKIIEAIAYGCKVVSTQTGQLGVETSVCGDQLSIIRDKDWEGFAAELTRSVSTETQTPDSFYAYYYWGRVIRKLNEVLAVI